DRKSTRLNFSHLGSSYAVFCLKKKTPFPTFSKSLLESPVPICASIRCGTRSAKIRVSRSFCRGRLSERPRTTQAGSHHSYRHGRLQRAGATRRQACARIVGGTSPAASRNLSTLQRDRD